MYNRKNISSRWPLFTDSVVGIAISSLIISWLYFIPSEFIHNMKLKPPVATVAIASPIIQNPQSPMWLKIPSINVNAPVDRVKMTFLGAMDVPQRPESVGWFDQSSLPGEVGNAVIAGHSGMKDDIPAAFDNLGKLKAGDLIYVQDREGKNTVFIVRKIKVYDKDEDTASVFNSTDREVHLNLITCTGLWNITEKTHSERLVVFTDRVY